MEENNSNGDAIYVESSFSAAESEEIPLQTLAQPIHETGPYARGTRFFITANFKSLEYWDDIIKYLLGFKALRYGCAVEEFNRRNIKHRHIYIECEKDIRLYYKNMYGCNVQKARGKQDRVFDYFHKEAKGFCWEYGTPILYKSKGKLGKKAMEAIEDDCFNLDYTLRQIKDMSQEERLDLPYQTLHAVKHFNLLEKNVIRVGEWHKEKFKAIYLYGRSGIGKSKMAECLIKENGYDRFCVVAHIGDFWHGYTPLVKAAIYDDFRPSDIKPVDFIKFMDYNKQFLNVKNGSFLNTLELVIFTSIVPPDELYKRIQEEYPETPIQWKRRLECINLDALDKYDLTGRMDKQKGKKLIKVSEDAVIHIKNIGEPVVLDRGGAFSIDL